MKRILFAACAIVTAAPMPAQTDVSIYMPGVTAEGVVYFLPKTMLSVVVTTTEQIYTPGEFAHYAERYMRMTGIDENERREWKISDVSVEAYGIPETSQGYSVRINGKSTAPLITLTKDGIISSINVPSSTATRAQEPEQIDKEVSDPHEFLTEEILTATSKAKMAELTAKEIFNIRESRNDITRGQADYIPADGESLKYILEHLDRQEKSLLKLFTGTNETITHTTAFNISPDDTGKENIIFRMSVKLGVLDSLNLAGAPVYISIENLGSQPESSVKKKKDTNSVRYCVPGRAHVKVYDNRSTYYDGVLSVAQFGNIETLSTTLLTKSTNNRIVFDTATGNIVSISE